MTDDDYNNGYRDGYDVAYTVGFAEGQAHVLQMKLEEQRELLNRAMDARINALLTTTQGERMAVCNAEAALHKALDDHFAKKAVYQGVNTLCASCGQPVGNEPVRDQDGDGNTYFYCSDKCWHSHSWGVAT